MMRLFSKCFFAACFCVTISGCVERVIQITSQPPGAIVWLNGEEVGATPVTSEFTWYGRYGVTVRKEGYQTIRAARNVKAPVYQWPILDFFSECFLPFTVKDKHHFHFELDRRDEVDITQLSDRARHLRDKTLSQSEKIR